MTQDLPQGHREDPYITPWFTCPLCFKNVEVTNKFVAFDRAECYHCGKTIAMPGILKKQVASNVSFKNYLGRAKDDKPKGKDNTNNRKAPVPGLGDYSSLLPDPDSDNVRDV